MGKLKTLIRASATLFNFVAYSHAKSDQIFNLKSPDDRFHRKLDLSSSEHVSVPTFPEGHHSPRHFINLYLGDPPQLQTLRVDTGSSRTSLPCSESCKNSCDKNKVFLQQDSNTFHKLDCSQCQQSEECDEKTDSCEIKIMDREMSSWVGYEARDKAYVIGSPQKTLFFDVELSQTQSEQNIPFDLKFDCQSSIETSSPMESGGVVGISKTNESFLNQIIHSDAASSKAFSLCLGSGGGGTLTIGGFDTRLLSSPMMFAKNVQSTDFFKVWVNDIYLQDNGFDTLRVDVDVETLNGDGIMLDSGRMETYFTSQLDGPFRSAWKKITGSDYSNDPISLSNFQLRNLPTILFDLQVAHPITAEGFLEHDEVEDTVLLSSHKKNVIISMPASHYMQPIAETGKYQSQFYVGYDEGENSVFGANFMQGHYIFFDIENQRIGFAESSCTLTPTLQLGQSDEKKSMTYCSSLSCRFFTVTGLVIAFVLALSSWYGYEQLYVNFFDDSRYEKLRTPQSLDGNKHSVTLV